VFLLGRNAQQLRPDSDLYKFSFYLHWPLSTDALQFIGTTRLFMQSGFGYKGLFLTP